MSDPKKNPLAVENVLYYELASSRIAPLVSWGWLQELVGKFYANKVRRKLARYERFLMIKQALKTMKVNDHE